MTRRMLFALLLATFAVGLFGFTAAQATEPGTAPAAAVESTAVASPEGADLTCSDVLLPDPVNAAGPGHCPKPRPEILCLPCESPPVCICDAAGNCNWGCDC